MSEKNTKTTEPRFTAAELAASKRFSARRDLVITLLGSGKYTATEAEEKINNYLKGKVK